MEYMYDLPPEQFSEYRNKPFLWRVLRSNGRVFMWGPLYLLWRGEWRHCCKLYLPVLLEIAVSCGVIAYGAAVNARSIYQIGVASLGVGLLWNIVLNIYMELFWNDTPHPQRRHKLLAVLGAVTAMGMITLCVMVGIIAGGDLL